MDHETVFNQFKYENILPICLILYSFYQYWNNTTTDIIFSNKPSREILFPDDIKKVILSYLRKYGDDYLDNTVEYGKLSELITNGTIKYGSIISYNRRCVDSEVAKYIDINAMSTNMVTGTIDYHDWESEEFNNESLPLVLKNETYVAYIRKRNNIKKWKDDKFQIGTDIILLYVESRRYEDRETIRITTPTPPSDMKNHIQLKFLDGIISQLPPNTILSPLGTCDEWKVLVTIYIVNKFGLNTEHDVRLYIQNYTELITQ
jgi:hypothetical protein